ncbi:MAG: DNA gyrase inhibitor YacG [Pseudomonadota bacterium]
MQQQSRTRRVNCPTCGALVEWSTAQRWRPFCSERCRLIDLGGWLDGSHRIPTEEPADAADDRETN